MTAQTQLSNGIPVVLAPTDTDVAAIYWWNHTGSWDELPTEAGFAHFLEHMHFKDTDAKSSGKASTGELAHLLESVGGDVNAYTSFDQTVYHVTFPSPHFDTVLGAFSRMAQPQSFLDTDFKREREVILEELRKNLDSPSRIFFQNLFENNFGKHPYGKPVIGYVKTLNAASVKTLEAFYKRNYVASRMGLVVSYPEKFSSAEVMKKLEKSFGKISAKKTVDRKKAEFKYRDPSAEFAYKAFHFEVQTPSLGLAFQAPAMGHPDIAALDVIGSALGSGESCRLYQELFYGKKMVLEIGGGLYAQRQGGMIYFTADFQDLTKGADILREILAQIEKIKKEGITPEEMSRILVQTESERVYSQQTADGRASRLAFLCFQMGDMSYDQKYLDQLKALKPEDIREVARKYFQPSNASLVMMVPKKQELPVRKTFESVLGKNPLASKKPDLAKLDIKGGAKAPTEKKKTAALPEIFHLKDGTEVVFKFRPQSEVFSLQSFILGGSRLERKPGLASLISSVWAKGSTKKNSKEIARYVEGKAAGFDAYSGRNTFGLSLSGMRRDFEGLTNLWGEVFWDPAFLKDEVELAKSVTLDSIKSLSDQSSSYCSYLFLKTLYDQHPYARLVMGDEASVSSIYSNHLMEQYREWATPEKMVLSIVGNVSSKQLQEFLDRFEREAARRKSMKLPTQAQTPVVIPQPELKAPRWAHRAFGREQEHILVGGLGLTFQDPQRPVLQVLHHILGGQSGRLFLDLREKQSLAYTVAPTEMDGLESGYVGTYIGCSPEKREKAIQGIRKVYETLAKKGPSAKEMSRAKEYFLGHRVMELQSDSAMANSYGLARIYGLPIRTSEQVAKEIGAVSTSQIQKFIHKYYLNSPQVTVVVG